MVKYTQTIRRQQPANCLSVLDHFVKLELELELILEGKFGGDPLLDLVSDLSQNIDLNFSISKFLVKYFIYKSCFDFFKHGKVVGNLNQK